MPYSTQRDRTPHLLEITKSPWPLPPLNFFVRSAFKAGSFDLTWDDPATLAVNSQFKIYGVNIYRSFDSEFGPFERVTEFPLGVSYWRDQTDNVLVEEDVSSSWQIFGAAGNGMDQERYVFKTLHPIVKEGSQGVYANSPYDVRVFVDDQPAKILKVQGFYGEVELDVRFTPEVGIQNYSPAVVPTENSVVRCTYRYTRSLVKTNQMQRVFYRITTVGLPTGGTELVETPIAEATATNSYEIEKTDYMWREAIRRNHWILDQGGERVLLFLRKNAGLLCPCNPDDYHKQPVSDCEICYGTAYVGGYEGPYETIVAPDDAERRITQKEQGRHAEHSYEVWTGPVPVLSQRDFLVKINGERYGIGAVRFPTNRGMLLQQHFQLAKIEDKDIRYRVPVDNPVRFAAIQFTPRGPENGASTAITNKETIPQERQIKGETTTFENHEY